MTESTKTSANQVDSHERLMFQPFSSILSPGFWQQLSNVKLNDLRLSTDPVDITGSYSCSLSENLPCLASFDHNSFTQTSAHGNNKSFPLTGQLVCTNILQDFIDYDKKDFLDRQGKEVWRAILSGEALRDPEGCLSRFGLLVYGDLKKYKFFYWFSFPAINYPREVYQESSAQPVLRIFNESLLAKIQTEYDKPNDERNFQRGYFLVKHDKTKNQVEVLPLTSYELIEKENSDIYFTYSDPSANQVYLGWPLRNYLALIAVRFRLNKIKLLRIRKGSPVISTSSASNSSLKLDLCHSTVREVSFQLDEKYQNRSTSVTELECPLITGWEKNESQQMAPKRVNLSSLLDPKKIAEDAVNLNLKLMKWRLLPSLDLDKIANSKCLILGCGTLGCHIARGLLAWGVKNISLVDNSKVSYSNPVRQSLYSFEDCITSDSSNSNRGRYKCEAAAASLRRIHPTVNVESYVLSIPMPGHHVTKDEYEQVKQTVEKLERLIDGHDAIFLLMDTRESRWLPTVIAISKQKLVINAAIGFDTFLLQRYGIRDYSSASTSDEKDSGDRNFLNSNRLGCYFCNDIVAPGDSTLDRTLDQQCTVTRPGVSMLVSALAVELFASVVSSELGSSTPAPVDNSSRASSNQTKAGTYHADECTEVPAGSELGIVPHSIRGNLSNYFIYMPTSPCFNKCSACSLPVIDAYCELGYDKFLYQVLNDPSYLEEITGLKDLQNVNDSDVLAIESDEDNY